MPELFLFTLACCAICAALTVCAGIAELLDRHDRRQAERQRWGLVTRDITLAEAFGDFTGDRHA